MKAFAHGHDACLSIWAEVYAQRTFDFPKGGCVLEIGCAEADWIRPMLDLRSDLEIWGIDWRHASRHGVKTIVQGDVLSTDRFTAEQFDAIVGISSVEHIGLGHYDSDPTDVMGDTRCLERSVEWLKPGGWMYLDVPYDPSGFRLAGTKCRIYDDESLARRLLVPGLTDAKFWYADHHGKLHPKPTVSDPPFSYVALWARKA